MALPMGSVRYRVEESPHFGQDWSRGVAEGWITSTPDASTLQVIKEHLANKPWSGQNLPGLPENVRSNRFPRSVAYDQGRVTLWYSIIEDDRIVVLERIFPNSVGDWPEWTLPGGDFPLP